MKTTKYLTQAAAIAAMYVALTIIVSPISSGLFQLRIAEALTILPYFTQAAIPGLFAGCAIANIIGGNGPIDVVIGSLATISAAYLSSKMPKKILVPMPPVIINAVAVGFVLNYVINAPLFFAMAMVGLGQLAACYGIGYPLMALMEKYRSKLF